ncbi:MAG: FtsQ-type POTRA domain-containing protein [Clostridia bacterium]|nr:FtsQ-type POTRA domain-containing protein [Clostridia bacterium]
MKREVERDEFKRKRMERQRKIRKRRFTAFFVIFIITAICVGAVLSLTVFFNIEHISIKGSKIYSAEEILKASELSKKNNLFATSENTVEEKIKAKLPYVESIDFKRELPHTLTVTVKDAVEFANYKLGEKYYKVTSSGWVLEELYEKPENLMLITAQKVKCRVGSEVIFEDITQKTLVDDIIKSLENEKIKVNEIDTTNIVGISLIVDNRFEVNLGTANNINEKIKHLGGMIKELPEDEKGKIDLSIWSKDNTKGTFKAEK